MEWINDPPCYAMVLKVSDPVGGKLELTGPAAGERVTGGIMAAMGAVFGTSALAFLRSPIPIPMPFKLIPLTVGLVGGGIGALGAATATSEASVRVERGKGIRFRWKLMPMRARELFIPEKDIAGWEISRTEHTSKDKHGFTTEHVRYRLNVVRKTGEAVAFEAFRLHTQARLRQEQIEAVMRPVEPPGKKAGTKTPVARKKTPASKVPKARKKASARKTTRPSGAR